MLLFGRAREGTQGIVAFGAFSGAILAHGKVVLEAVVCDGFQSRFGFRSNEVVRNDLQSLEEGLAHEISVMFEKFLFARVVLEEGL